MLIKYIIKNIEPFEDFVDDADWFWFPADLIARFVTSCRARNVGRLVLALYVHDKPYAYMGEPTATKHISGGTTTDWQKIETKDAKRASKNKEGIYSIIFPVSRIITAGYYSVLFQLRDETLWIGLVEED